MQKVENYEEIGKSRRRRGVVENIKHVPRFVIVFFFPFLSIIFTALKRFLPVIVDQRKLGKKNCFCLVLREKVIRLARKLVQNSTFKLRVIF